MRGALVAAGTGAGAGLLAAIGLAGALQAGTVYKCRDEAGRIRYADRPCPGAQAQSVIEVTPPAEPAGAAPRDGPGSMERVLEAFRIQREALERERGERRAESARVRLERCAALAEHLARLDGRHCDASGACGVYSLVETDAEGNQVVLSESAKRAEIERVKGLIAEDCG